ncbi:SIR2 family protein [Caulobacter sp. CCG-8]|uniref:protein kinase domain-containing protein n=1 Tax=Caulobacter sp. CCG-8 TaxID=3127958 RepID=UPI00307F017B
MSFNLDQPAYQRLRVAHAERRRPLAFWVGAGLSQPAGLPGWKKLRDELVSQALETTLTLPPDQAREKEVDIELASSNTNFWEAFESLKKVMGRAEYKATMRSVLTPDSSVGIPETYKAIWALPGVGGMLTLNLDEFASKSHKRARPNEDPVTFFGRDATEYAHVVGARRTFIANLHGVMDAERSWVFTKSEIGELTGQGGYRNFINFIFANMTVVFLGISAEDSSAGGFLERLTAEGLDLGGHYWITHRTDAATHAWAANADISIIRYNPETNASGGEDHSAPILTALSDLRSFVSRDENASALIPNVIQVENLPSVKELRMQEDDDLRNMLSGYARKLLEGNGGDTNSEEYVEFLKTYSPCVHQAWHITSEKPHNKFYHYEVVSKISSSPFSNVWKIKGGNGQVMALKTLRIENLHSGPQIESFRRGVKSLEYLTSAQVPGTAKLFDAYEIPSSVVMEFVEGSTLHDIVQNPNFSFWDEGLSILFNVCEHLRYSHNLPQGVLHRDVRPSNIMVPKYYWQEDDAEQSGSGRFDVTLLNYDMSWHANAAGQTISGNLEEAGYYAPEQTSSKNSEASRSTLVDSFGCGMCVFYAFTRRQPPTGGSKSTDWQQELSTRFRADTRLRWRSAPSRLKRTIEKACAPDPNDRMPIERLSAELKLLQQATAGDFEALPADYWAEELISRSEQADYIESENGSEFLRTPRAGRSIKFRGDLRSKSVVLTFQNQALPSTNRSGMDRVWADKLLRAREILTSSGWEIVDGTRYGNMEILLTARISVSELKGKFEKILESLKKGLDQVRIE